MVHLLYIGHFVHENALVRYQDHRPFVLREIQLDTVTGLLKKCLGESASPENLPDEWGMSIFPEYIQCSHSGPPSVLQFAAYYAEQEGAIILDLGSFQLLTPEQLRRYSMHLAQQIRENDAKTSDMPPVIS